MQRKKKIIIGQILSTKSMQWTMGLFGKVRGMLKEVVKEDFMVEKEGRKEYARRNKERNETNCKEKILHGKFPKSVVDFTDSVWWQWLSSGYIYIKKKQLLLLLRIKPCERTG